MLAWALYSLVADRPSGMTHIPLSVENRNNQPLYVCRALTQEHPQALRSICNLAILNTMVERLQWNHS